MWTILPNLLLGDREDAGDLRRLRAAGVTHVLNCAKELPCRFPGEFIYLRLDLTDPDPALVRQIDRACDFIDTGRRGGTVLVHCTAAVSRSPAVVLAYLCHTGMTLVEAAEHVSRVVLTGVDESFLGQLARRFQAATAAADIQRLSLTLLGRTE